MCSRSRTQSVTRRGSRGSYSTYDRNMLRLEERLENQRANSGDGSCPHCGNPEFASMYHCEECGTSNHSDNL